MTRPTIDDDLTLAFILGRNAGGLSFVGSVALTFVACLGVAAAAATGVVSGDLAFACFAVAVLALSWWSSPAAAATSAIVAFLFVDGFAFDSAGILAWHGEADLLRLVALVGLAVIGSFLGSGRRARTRDRVGRDAAHPWVAS